MNSNMPSSTISSCLEISNEEQSITKRKVKFITKLLDILENKDLEEIISWNKDGNIIEIKSETKFIEEILPKYFKYSKMTNFIRSLNMYNFKKIKDYDKEGAIAYSNSFFKKDCHSLINKIERKNILNKHNYINKNHSRSHYPKEESSSDQNFKISNIFLIEKIELLFQQINNLEDKVAQLENSNNQLSGFNKNQSYEVKNKTMYIDRLESLVFFIINFILPNNLQLATKNSNQNSPIKKTTKEEVEDNFKLDFNNIEFYSDDESDHYKIKPIEELQILYDHMSKDLINGKTDDLPETKKILKKLRINQVRDDSEDESPNSSLNKKRIHDSPIKDNNQRIIDSENFFESILKVFFTFCRNRQISKANKKKVEISLNHDDKNTI